MKIEANWCMRIGAVVLVLMLVFAAFSCGGGGGVNLAPDKGSTADVIKESGLIAPVSESEIATLPKWQQELLSDPGWNQPYIAPREGTPTEPPSLESLWQATAEGLEKGVELMPRAGQGSKGASWLPPQLPPSETIDKAEYQSTAPNATPSYGCNNVLNSSSDNHALEDLILANANTGIPANRISYVNEGLAAVNIFNNLAGTNKSARACVYQTYASVEGIDPANPPAGTLLGEVSYRSDLAPGIGIGGVCSATAYAIYDALGATPATCNYFWTTFNAALTATPGMQPVATYDVLIAPAGNQSTASQISVGGTSGRTQPYYFGTISNCFGGSMIIGLIGSTSTCTKFKDYFDSTKPATYNPPFWYKPVYGVLLKRWQDMMAPGQTGPWQTQLGWPVYGPYAYASGAQQLGPRGTFYQWGMWYEYGFIWWVDYDQDVYPNTPDEAQAFWYAKNVYCAAATDGPFKIAPTVYYGGSGPLGVSVAVDAYRNVASDPWAAMPLNATASEYQVNLNAADGKATMQIKMRANGYGGVPNAACLYKTYVWAFRDGTVQPAGADYSAAQMTAVHTYGDLSFNKESKYVVRCQVQDSGGALAYGDSLPIVLGHGAGGGGGGTEIMVIRDDPAAAYPTNFTALTDDLTAIGGKFTTFNYDSGVNYATKFTTENWKVAIWYRGGPGGGSEANCTTAWNATEEQKLSDLMSVASVFIVSQAHSSCLLPSIGGYTSAHMYNGASKIAPALMTHPTDQLVGLMSNEVNGTFISGGSGGWAMYIMWGGECFTGGNCNYGVLPGTYGNEAAELTSGAPGSGKIASNFSFGSPMRQYTAKSWYPPFGTSYINTGFRNGINTGIPNPAEWTNHLGSAMSSWGCRTGPGMSPPASPKRNWTWGFSYGNASVTAPAGVTRKDILQNVLAWCNNTLTWGAGGGSGGGAAGGFTPYADVAQIVTVSPCFWSGTTYKCGATSVTGLNYPDRDPGADTILGTGDDLDWPGTDVYRTTDPNGPTWDSYLLRTVVPSPYAGYTEDGANTNDLDFQFPFYAYINPGGNGVVELGAGAPIDDTVFFSGLLLQDAVTSWNRNYTYVPYDPVLGPAFTNVPRCVFTGAYAVNPVCVAGYYVATTIAGDSGDEVRANYGQAVPSFPTSGANKWDNKDKLWLEAIAHWATTGAWAVTNPGGVKMWWSMFPGHRMRIPGTATYLTDSTNRWDSFRQIFDIDKNNASANWLGVLRSNTTWNQGMFDYTEPTAEGRVVSFNYRSNKMWNPDLNRDGTINYKDKFPVRARIFANYTLYTTLGNWPNAEQQRTYLDTTVTPNVVRPVYAEGGCYVADTGQSVYTMQILDDALWNNPGGVGTISYQGPAGGGNHTWRVTCGYEIKFGTGPYNTGFQYSSGGPFTPAAVTYANWHASTPGPQLPPHAAPGKYHPVAEVTGPASATYTIRVNCVDSDAPPVTQSYTWAGFTMPPLYVFGEDFESGTNGSTTLSTVNTWTTGGHPYTSGPSNNQWINSTQGYNVAYGGPSAAQGGTHFATCNAHPYNYGGMHHFMEAGPFPCSTNTSYTFTFYTAGSAEMYYDGLVVGYGFDGTTYNLLSQGINTAYDVEVYGLYFWYGQWNPSLYSYAIGFSYYPPYGGYYDTNTNLGGTSWVQHSYSFNSGANTNVYVLIGISADPSVDADGPALDTMRIQ